MSEKWHGGKGSKPRKQTVSPQTFNDNFDRIFRKPKDTAVEPITKGNVDHKK